ncbi:hypothetical protein LOD99_3725 [Oopsacas minuta]|uniref:Uncharacterized protein n=1 Tax=Oopsacas minuta TaxID=111878 RepID=A0AAV7JXZ0_9METZ|nr:hypothetical protein LOD99_3725 [Oopsacas minuta]
MGNRIRSFSKRSNQVSEIHIKRPLKCTEFCEKPSSPTHEHFPNQDETTLLKNPELSPQQDNTSEIQVKSAEVMNTISSPNLVKAQQKLIEKLENELSNIRNELADTKRSFEQKLVKSRSKTASIRAETALIIYELRENISEIQLENANLLNKLHKYEKSNPELENGAVYSELILTLSEQVSSANEKLRDANCEIESLKQDKNVPNSVSDT